MKLIITHILLVASISLQGQSAEVVSGKKYRGAIFNSEYAMPPWTFTIKEKRFTPTSEEIDKIEVKLKLEINDLNSDGLNQGKGYGPAIHKNLRKYVRQYLGFINEKGERVILINCLWLKSSFADGWKEEWINVSDGGSQYWQVKYNLDQEQFYDFGVNGVA
ncbi:hypothetical protein [Ekhidna sp.]